MTVVTTPVGVSTIVALWLAVAVIVSSPSGVSVGKARMVRVTGRELVRTVPLASKASRTSE